MILKKKVGCYETRLKEEKKAKLDREIEHRIEMGIDVRMGVLPLMAVVQAHKEQGLASPGLSRADKYIMSLQWGCNQLLRRDSEKVGHLRLSI